MSNPKVSDTYEKLYHYTTWEGVLGILKTQSLWATHYKFLNDTSEIELFRPVLEEYLTPHLSEIMPELLALQQGYFIVPDYNERDSARLGANHSRKVVDAFYRNSTAEIYLLSFCADDHFHSNGLLSQWRGYGKRSGIAVVFGTKRLEDMIATERAAHEYSASGIADVVYQGEDLPNDFQYHMEKIKQGAIEFCIKRARHREGDAPPEMPALEESAVPLISCMARYKHGGFKEEDELRGVFWLNDSRKSEIGLSQERQREIREARKKRPPKPRKFRENNGLLVPYIDLFDEGRNLDLATLKQEDITLPIERIIVGPHPQKEQMVATLTVMLRNTDIEVSASSIPYIP
jgi:hypothetical protein